MLTRIFLAMVFLLAIYSDLYGQPIAGNDTIAGSSAVFTSNKIRQLRPAIKIRTLETDLAKIQNSFPSIQQKYTELGYTKEETVEAVLYGWERVRVDSPLQAGKSINSNSFVEYMSDEFLAENGKVQFISEPDKADLTVNGIAVGQTKKSKWYPVNESLTVVCKKDGFQAFETTCSVAPGKNECPCNMKPAQRSNF